MNYFSITNLIIVAINLPIGIFLLATSRDKKANRLLGYLCIAAVIWGIGSYNYSITNSKEIALFWWQIANVGSIFSTVIFYYFILSYLNIKRKFLSVLVNLVTVFYLYLNFFYSGIFIGNLKFTFNQFYYISWPSNVLSPYLIYYFCFFFLLLSYSFYVLVKEYIKTSGLRRLQMKYLILGMVIGFIGCHACFLPIFGLHIYPYLNILIAFYTAPICYAIIKYRLMDIKLAVTRAGIFLILYTLILGIPFWLGFNLLGSGLWLLPMAFMAFFATLGPFIYFYVQRHAENQLLQEQRRYQTTLRQASAGMSRIKELKRLLNLIVYVVARAVRLEHALVYVHDANKQQYLIGAHKLRVGYFKFPDLIPESSPLIKYFKNSTVPIVYEEIKRKAEDTNDEELKAIEKVVLSLEGAIIFPIIIEERLLAIIVLGKKISGKFYGEDDLSVFTILANQAALAIENAQFYEDMKKTQEQLFQAEKMATIGTMADGLSHQINNRFHALGFISGDALDTIQMNKNEPMSEKLKEIMKDLEQAFTRVQENVVQGGEIVQGLLRYTRKGDAGFSPIEFEAAFKSAYEMAQFKIKVHDLKIIKTYDPSVIPKIKGNFTQLQEVFFNLIDNGYDAMMQRKTEQKEPGYQPTLKLHITSIGPEEVEIIFQDNGIGVKDDDTHKLFTPFFTTKLSSKKGTGLGLYVIKKIIEDNHKGRVEMVSKYMVGTQMKLYLPIAQ
jgi:signal transduction histidine kinase